MKTEKIDPKILATVKKENKKNNGIIESSKNLAKKLKEQDQKSKKSEKSSVTPAVIEIENDIAKAKKTAKSEKPKTKKEKKPKTKSLTRIIIPVEQQTKYMKRSYRRDFHKNEELNVVVNGTSHTADQAEKQCYEFMQNTFKATGDKVFTTTDLIAAIGIYGVSYGDRTRLAMQKLAKDGKIKISLDKTSKRRRYKYTLVIPK